MMKKMKLIFLLLISAQAFAKDKVLDDLLQVTTDHSLAEKAAAENLSASLIEKERSGKHWLPQIYLTGQSFVSNDPGTALFGKLSQREITNSDFMADSLNHPASSVYTKATLGVNLSLYEGGQKVAMYKAMTHLSESKVYEARAIRNEFSTEVVKNYILGKNFYNEHDELSKIQSTIDSIISRYQLGNRQNQLGYSGLLGLKSLKNKVLGLLDENNAKRTAITKALVELTGPGHSINFSSKYSTVSLVKEYLSFSENSYVASSKVESLFQNAKSANEIIDAEKSRNLPRVGLFGEGYAFNGNRSLGNGYSTGIYLNWNLFSGNDYGADLEAIHKSRAAQYFAEANLQKEKIEYEGLKESLVAINNSLILLSESEKFLDEQTKISHGLFKNGLINVLQYVEVLSRRVDLIKSKSLAETELIEVHSKLAKNKKDIISQGVDL
jgi:outer membrane protein TolC